MQVENFGFRAFSIFLVDFGYPAYQHPQHPLKGRSVWYFNLQSDASWKRNVILAEDLDRLKTR